jgi:hypothetical protein
MIWLGFSFFSSLRQPIVFHAIGDGRLISCFLLAFSPLLAMQPHR